MINCIYKDDQFRDNPFSARYPPAEDLTAGFFQEWKYNLNRAETFELARELRSIADTYAPERFLLGELFGDDDTIRRYLGEQADGLNLVFLWKLVVIQQ